MADESMMFLNEFVVDYCFDSGRLKNARTHANFTEKIGKTSG